MTLDIVVNMVNADCVSVYTDGWMLYVLFCSSLVHTVDLFKSEGQPVHDPLII